MVFRLNLDGWFALPKLNRATIFMYTKTYVYSRSHVRPTVVMPIYSIVSKSIKHTPSLLNKVFVVSVQHLSL